MMGGPTRFQKVSRPWCNMVAYYIMFLLVVALKVVFSCSHQHFIWSSASLGLDFLALILHMCLACRDPGHIRNDRIDFMKLLEAFEPQSLCPECNVIRSGRSRHCIICQRCIDRYDHHCPWINNCVGIKNHNLFMVYLIV